MNPLEIKLKTLTPIWTGGVETGKMDRLHETGIIGSLRWWYEAIVRGLGGHACDPTGNQSCPDKHGKRCAVCELFGCTSWQRKFKLLILDKNKRVFNIKPHEKDGLAEGTPMIWRFVELRSICDEEKWLLYQAIRIASEYGAIGGRTPRKPQNNKKVGGDFGLFSIQQQTGFPQEVSKQDVMNWSQNNGFRQIKPDNKWPNLRWFFFVHNQYLKREAINNLIGLSKNGKRITSHKDFQNALRGQRAVSKKIFSFETPPGRIWGYLPSQEMCQKTIAHLQQLEIKPENIKTGEEVLNEL